MPAEASPGADRVPAAEVLAALCLATDLAMGLPFEHGLHRTQVAMRLAERIGVDPETASDAYTASASRGRGSAARPRRHRLRAWGRSR